MNALNKKTIEDIDVKGKRVLVRCDFNVPLKDGAITNDKRIVESLPTIKYILNNGGRAVLCSHLGRPKGTFNMDYSLAPVAKRLSELLGQDVKLASEVVGESAKKLSAELKDGEAMLIENVRFHAEEEKIDPRVCKGTCFPCRYLLQRCFRNRPPCPRFHSRGSCISPRSLRIPHPEGNQHYGRRS